MNPNTTNSNPVEVEPFPKTTKGRSRFRIQWKILLLMLLFTGIIVLGMWLSMVVFLDEIYQKVKMDEIEDSATALAGEIGSIGQPSILLFAEDIAEKRHISLLVYDIKEKSVLCAANELENSTLYAILYPNNIYGIKNFSTKNAEILCRAVDGDSGNIYYRVTGNEKQPGDKQIPDEILTLQEGIELESEENATSILYISLTEKQGKKWAIFINAVISPVQATVNTIRTILIIVTPALFLLSVLLSMLISFIIAKPIKRLTDSAKVLATGNYAVTFPRGGYKEASELSDALNFAAGELSKVDSLQRELVANVSHDLRTPLTMIAGYAEIMRDIPGENTAENLQIVIDESERLRELVVDLLDLSRLQSGTMQPKKTVFCLTDAVENAMTRYHKLRDRDGYQIEFFYDRRVMIEADYDMLLQVIYNLVNNAVNYTGEDKRVTVRQTTEGNTVRISVCDTGSGIPPEKMALIFDRYYRDTGNHRRAAVGSGLGLSIVKSILVAHGGRYGVSSAVGHGSDFWFELGIL